MVESKKIQEHYEVFWREMVEHFRGSKESIFFLKKFYAVCAERRRHLMKTYPALTESDVEEFSLDTVRARMGAGYVVIPMLTDEKVEVGKDLGNFFNDMRAIHRGVTKFLAETNMTKSLRQKVRRLSSELQQAILDIKPITEKFFRETEFNPDDWRRAEDSDNVDSRYCSSSLVRRDDNSIAINYANNPEHDVWQINKSFGDFVRGLQRGD